MESRVKLLGHPIHPMLVMFPVALFTVAVVFDVLYLATGTDELARFAFWSISIGLVFGLGAAVFGLIDWLGIRMGTRARRVGAWHGLGNAALVLLFALSWLLRIGDLEYAPGILPFVVALIGIGIALVTAWLGGELVYRLRIGVDDIASDDAPSSLGAGSPHAAAREQLAAQRPKRVT
ncbi:MAG TPA: DUF2231 domain-containing protein [Candidatus Limnocylindrales bacterium]|nr:DUF2231 domain-containing protein [Candidatus Limnocylindrales bacterium]